MHGRQGRTIETGHGAGRHVCAVVDDDGSHRDLASGFLADGRARGEKTVVFGPEGSRLRDDLRPLSSMLADPYVDVLGRRRLDPETMFATFREQSARAAREGFAGLRVAADMDWLLPAAPTTDEVVRFEAMLDRVVSEVGATVLCAYRRSSFDRATLIGTLCTHPSSIGHDVEPPFRLVWQDGDGWRLSGAVDHAAAGHFVSALRATAAAPWVIDAAGLEFLDAAGMWAMADVARAAAIPLELRNARAPIGRYWELAGFDDIAPAVRFTR